jgi:putative phosphoesterase
MEIAIFSDIHDNLKNLELAINQIKDRGINKLIYCGDFCAPFVMKQLGQSGLEIHAVWGNNDGDRFKLTQIADQFPTIKLYGEYIGDEDCLLEIDGVKIGVTHYHFYAKTMIKTGWYDLVCFGHSHKSLKQKFGNSLLINPGEVAGIFGPATYAIYDTHLRGSEIITL